MRLFFTRKSDRPCRNFSEKLNRASVVTSFLLSGHMYLFAVCNTASSTSLISYKTIVYHINKLLLITVQFFVAPYTVQVSCFLLYKKTHSDSLPIRNAYYFCKYIRYNRKIAYPHNDFLLPCNNRTLIYSRKCNPRHNNSLYRKIIAKNKNLTFLPL